MQHFIGEPGGVALHRSAQQLEIDLQQRHLLADVVVQLARDPRALGFLRVQQPRAEVADSLVAGEQLRLLAVSCSSARRRLTLCTSSPRDQRRLRQKERAPQRGCSHL